MTTPITFPGVNLAIGSPQFPSVEAFSDGVHLVSCWEFSDAEIAEIILRKRIYLTQLSGQIFYPTMIAGASDTRALVAALPPQFKEQMQ